MHQRHLVNYVPGRGYIELRSPDAAEDLQHALSMNVIADQTAALADDFLQLEMRAYLRLRLCLHLLTAIDGQHGVYHIHHAGQTNRRRNWLNQFECPASLSGHIEAILV